MTDSVPQGYSIAAEDDSVVIRLDRSVLSEETIAFLLDYLELQAIRRRSALDEGRAAKLADDIDRAVWEASKGRFLDAEE